jgi:NADP-dependent 3-hydroxy acid dehydrogenase YdfG
MQKTIFITGTSSGIGKLTAIYFANKGWNVAATMRRVDKEKELNTYRNIKVLTLDVTDEKSISEAIKDTIDTFGGIDVLLNNAGLCVIGPFEAMTNEQIKKQFDVNILGVMNVTRAILPYFREKRNGMIINTSSIGGLISFPLFSCYNSTKWALEGFMESLQYEVKQFNIQIKTVQPAQLKTNFEDSTVYVTTDSYNKYTSVVRKKISEMFQKGQQADIVAKTIFKIASNTYVGMRFPVGVQSKVALLIRWLTPLHWFLFLFRSEFEKGINMQEKTS